MYWLLTDWLIYFCVVCIDSHTWQQMTCTNAPSARYGHAAVALPGTNSIMVLFGAEQDRNINDAHILDTGMQSTEFPLDRLMTENANR